MQTVAPPGSARGRLLRILGAPLAACLAISGCGARDDATATGVDRPAAVDFTAGRRPASGEELLGPTNLSALPADVAAAGGQRGFGAADMVSGWRLGCVDPIYGAIVYEFEPSGAVRILTRAGQAVGRYGTSPAHPLRLGLQVRSQPVRWLEIGAVWGRASLSFQQPDGTSMLCLFHGDGGYLPGDANDPQRRVGIHGAPLEPVDLGGKWVCQGGWRMTFGADGEGEINGRRARVAVWNDGAGLVIDWVTDPEQSGLFSGAGRIHGSLNDGVLTLRRPGTKETCSRAARHEPADVDGASR